MSPTDPADLTAEQQAQHRHIYNAWFHEHRVLSYLRDRLQSIAWHYEDMRLSEQPVDVTVLRTLLVDAPTGEVDPMDGAIGRLKEGGLLTERDVDLALNEAFRNGQRSERERHVCEEPIGVWVTIPNLAQHNVSGGVNDRDWWARRRINEYAAVRPEPGASMFPVYQITGDPNAVAVGRFKAGLRRFIGVE